MLETAIVIFREGLEAFLIVAIMLAYVANTGRHHLRKPIISGIVVALIISATTGYHVAELAQDPLWEGGFALLAGALVASFTIYIMKNAKHFRNDITARLSQSFHEVDVVAEIGVFIFTILMIIREGMETALLLGTLSAQEENSAMLLGGAIGAGLVAFIGYLWVTQSSKINLRLFLQVTGVFLVLFACELFLYGLHELSEMNAIPLIGENMNINFHIWTEVIEEPFISNAITFFLFIVPTIWLTGAALTQNKEKTINTSIEETASAAE